MYKRQINSIRARADRAVAWLERTGTDVLALQETKCANAQFPYSVFEAAGYEVAHVGSSQWNGVAIASRVGLADVATHFAGQPSFGDPNPVVEARALGATCGGVRQDQHRTDHHVEAALVRCQVAPDELPAHAEPGVVDQQAHRAVAVAQPLGHPLGLRPVGQVGGEHLGAHAGCSGELAGEVFQTVGVPGHQDDVVPCGRQLPGELQAEARARTGDQCGSHGTRLRVARRG